MLVVDYYYYATAGGAKIWVRCKLNNGIYNSLSCSSGRSISLLCKSPNSLSISLLSTLPVRILFLLRQLNANQMRISKAYTRIAFTHGLPTKGDCAGELPAALYGCALLTFYLVLFIDFYRRTYNAASKKAATNGSAVANGKTNGAL